MKIGIIGGSGLENPEIFTEFKTKEVDLNEKYIKYIKGYIFR